MSSRELGYFAIHLYHILWCWSYQFYIRFAHQVLYRFCSPGTKAYLQHEYKIIGKTSYPEALFTCLQDFWFFTYPGRSFVHSDNSCKSIRTLVNSKFSRLRYERADTPSAAFLRIIRNVHLLPTSRSINALLDGEIDHFWYRGITGVDKPDYYLFAGKWPIKDLPDPREKLGNDPLLCAIAASTATWWKSLIGGMAWVFGGI